MEVPSWLINILQLVHCSFWFLLKIIDAGGCHHLCKLYIVIRSCPLSWTSLSITSNGWNLFRFICLFSTWTKLASRLLPDWKTGGNPLRVTANMWGGVTEIIPKKEFPSFPRFICALSWKQAVILKFGCLREALWPILFVFLLLLSSSTCFLCISWGWGERVGKLGEVWFSSSKPASSHSKICQIFKLHTEGEVVSLRNGQSLHMDLY